MSQDYPSSERNRRFPSASSLREELRSIGAKREQLQVEEDRIVLQLAAHRNDEQLAGDLGLKTGPGARKRRMQAEARAEPELAAVVSEKIAKRRYRASKRNGRRLADELAGITGAEARPRRSSGVKSSVDKPRTASHTNEPPASPVTTHQLTPDWQPAKPQTLSEIEDARTSS